MEFDSFDLCGSRAKREEVCQDAKRPFAGVIGVMSLGARYIASALV
jgi:hypothetical protein